MKNIYLIALAFFLITGCGAKHDGAKFNAIKVFDGSFNVALETKDKQTIEKLNDLFYDRTIDNQMAPNFKYLIEVKTAEGAQRWKYSIDGYLKIHKQGTQPIYYLANKNEFNQLAKID